MQQTYICTISSNSSNEREYAERHESGHGVWPL